MCNVNVGCGFNFKEEKKMRNGKVQSKCENDYVREDVLELSDLVYKLVSKNELAISVDDPLDPVVPNAIDVRVHHILPDELLYDSGVEVFVSNGVSPNYVKSLVHIISVPDFFYRSINVDYRTTEYYILTYSDRSEEELFEWRESNDISSYASYIDLEYAESSFMQYKTVVACCGNDYEICGYPIDIKLMVGNKDNLCCQIAELYWSICDNVCELLHFIFVDGKVYVFDNYNV